MSIEVPIEMPTEMPMETPMETEKFKEALSTEDQLLIYAEFHGILKSIIELARQCPKGESRESTKKTMQMLVELKAAAAGMYEGLKYKSAEDVLADLESLEKLFIGIEARIGERQ